MSRLRANEVLNKDADGPFLATEGINIPVGKSVTSVSGVTTFDHDTLTTQNINVNRIDISDTVACQVILPTARVGFQDGASAYFGNSDDLRIYHSGTNSIIDASPVEIHHSGSKKFETTSTGIDVTGLNVSGTSTFQDNVSLGDNDRLNFGDNADFSIRHTGAHTNLVDTGQGNLYIAGSNEVIITNASINETKAKFITNGAVELYYDNSKKFETISTGVAITGTTTSTDGWAGTTSSANVLGGLAMPFTCGFNGRISLPPVNSTMIFGGSEYSGDNHEGAVMPHAGKLVAATMYAEQAVGNLTVSAFVNGTADTSYQMSFTSPTQSDHSVIETFYVTPLSFSAGDRLNFGVTTTTLSQLQVLTLTFFVKFD